MVSAESVAVATIALVLSFKVLLIPCYASTDFEVHRNWLAITHKLPLHQWYFDTTSEWTLDYPPLFAYFELALASVAETLGLDDILALQNEPLFNERVTLFQRWTVIVTDLLYMAGCGFLCFKAGFFTNLPSKIQNRARLGCFVLLICNAALLMVDNIHFQYNSMLTSLVILTIALIETESHLKAAFVFCVLLNFKHIYLYYAPALVFFYLNHYFNVKTFQVGGIITKGVKLAVVMILPFIVSLGPFLVKGGQSGLLQIMSRLFPVSRGLTHAYWAPNAWAMYNTLDLLAYRICSLLKIGNYVAPTYNTGLVQEHSHSVLPSISPAISLSCILIALSPLILLLTQRKRSEFSLYLVLSSLAFFFFGYHVHEKALLLVAIPLIVLAFQNARFVPVCVLFSTVTSFSLFPLLFTLFEIPIKYCIATTYTVLMLIMFRYAFNVRLAYCLPTISRLLIAGLAATEIYNTFIHKLLLGDHLPFLPLMVVSVFNSICVLFCYIWILKLAFEDEHLIYYKQKRCEVRELLIKQSAYSVQSVESLEEVEIVAGVDISTSKTNTQFGVVSISVYSFPAMEHIASHEEVVLITEPYISDYLAVRESGPIADVINRYLESHPEHRPDVLICDGNGQFHSRGCGVACHIGALSGIATVGVAKNLNLSLLKLLSDDKKWIEKADQLISQVCSQSSDGHAPFDLISPVCMNVVRMGGSKSPVFVSAGYGIDLSLGTQLVQMTARNRICEPIRTADLRSREKVRDMFDD